MNRRSFRAIVPFAAALRRAKAAGRNSPRERLLFDNDWRFVLGDPEGAESPSYDAASCGDIDICGNRRANSHYRNIVWNRGEKLFLGVRQALPEGKELRVTRWGVWPVYANWTWPGMEGKPLEVETYSRGDAVRLYLNGTPIGEKPTTRAEKFKANFSVPYAPGVLKA